MAGGRQSKLTTKQQAFVDHYQGNATEAAIKAGYSKNTAKEIGCENLTKPNIIAAIQARQEKPRTQVIATREERQAFWTRVLLGKEVEDGELPKMSDRLKASELLGRSEADFTDKVEGDLNLKVIRKVYDEKEEEES